MSGEREGEERGEREGRDRPEPQLSVVIPVKDEAGNVEGVAAEVAAALEGVSHEVVWVDDGSTDATFTRLRKLCAADPRQRALRLRRNRGKARAYQAGFRAARGELVATMDGDGQDDPRDLPRLRARLEADEVDLVIGWRQRRKNGVIYALLSPFSNVLGRALGRGGLHDINCPVRVMRREVATDLQLKADLHRYIPLLARARGYAVAEQPVENRPRASGSSKYSVWKYPASLTSFIGVLLWLRFGDRPLALFGTLGILTLVLGVAVDLKVVAGFAFCAADIDDDIPTLILGVLMILVGTHFIATGVLAEILLRRLHLLLPEEDEIKEEI